MNVQQSPIPIALLLEYAEQYVQLQQLMPSLMAEKENQRLEKENQRLGEENQRLGEENQRLEKEKENQPLNGLKKVSRSMVLAVVSLALMIPLVYIVLHSDMNQSALISIGVIGGVMVLINVAFNIFLFVVKS